MRVPTGWQVALGLIGVLGPGGSRRDDELGCQGVWFGKLTRDAGCACGCWVRLGPPFDRLRAGSPGRRDVGDTEGADEGGEEVGEGNREGERGEGREVRPEWDGERAEGQEGDGGGHLERGL